MNQQRVSRAIAALTNRTTRFLTGCGLIVAGVGIELGAGVACIVGGGVLAVVTVLEVVGES